MGCTNVAAEIEVIGEQSISLCGVKLVVVRGTWCGVVRSCKLNDKRSGRRYAVIDNLSRMRTIEG